MVNQENFYIIFKDRPSEYFLSVHVCAYACACKVALILALTEGNQHKKLFCGGVVKKGGRWCYLGVGHMAYGQCDPPTAAATPLNTPIMLIMCFGTWLVFVFTFLVCCCFFNVFSSCLFVCLLILFICFCAKLFVAACSFFLCYLFFECLLLFPVIFLLFFCCFVRETREF